MKKMKKKCHKSVFFIIWRNSTMISLEFLSCMNSQNQVIVCLWVLVFYRTHQLVVVLFCRLFFVILFRCYLLFVVFLVLREVHEIPWIFYVVKVQLIFICVDWQGIFSVQKHHSPKLTSIILQIKPPLQIRIYLHILNHTMMPTNRSISTKLNISITFPANDHAISLLKRNEVVDFWLFIITFINWIENEIGFLEFGKLYKEVNFVIQMDWIRQFNLAQLTL